MTDNIFEGETTALARFPCATRDSGILLTDFGCPYPCVKVEFAGKARGQFLMARGVRPDCPASEFLFTMAFDPFFRWLHDSVIPRDTVVPEFLQPAP